MVSIGSSVPSADDARSERERALTSDFFDLLAIGRFLALAKLGWELIGIARPTNRHHRFDLKIIRHLQIVPRLFAIESRHAVDDQAHRTTLQCEVFKSAA